MIEKRRNFVFRFLPGLFLSGLLLLSGCSQDDVSDVPAGSRAIDFRAQGGMSSLKATTASSNSIKSFVVSAHYSGASTWTATADYLLRGVTVYRGEDNKWAYSPQAYFPTATDGSVEFFAYSPSSSVSRNVKPGNGLNEASTADQTITYKVPAPDGSVTVQEDFLVAYKNVEPAGYKDAVPLQFRHALSRILVSAKSDLELPIAITGLKLRNVFTEGTLKLKDVSLHGASGWLYNGSISNTDNPDDVYVKWGSPSALEDFSYSLPASGVSIGSAYASVVGDDQGIFVLPQTTAGTDFSSKEDLESTTEFGLEIAYTINGVDAPEHAFVQFGDLNDIASTGVTFENGRQYVLNLSFGSGSGSNPNPDPNDPDTPSIVIGAKISFSTLVDDFDGPIDAGLPVVPPDPNKKYWAASNIYFDSASDNDSNDNTGALTFAESGTDKEGYQGVYFKWGSLIGVDAASGAFSDASYLFVPDLATGSYSRVVVSGITGSEDYLISGWSGSMDDKWNSIAYADVSVIDASVTNNRNDARLTTEKVLATSATGYADYTGDICKFLSRSSSRSATGLAEDWILPTSNNFGPVPTGNQYDAEDSVYEKYNEGENTAGNVNGIGGTLFGVKLSYVLNDDPVGFPASGARATFLLSTPPDVFSDYGYLHSVGDLGYYWSSSATDGALAYILHFGSGYVRPAVISNRTSGHSVRCVRSY